MRSFWGTGSVLATGTARVKALEWEEAQDTRGSGRAVWLECRGEGEWPGMRLRQGRDPASPLLRK